MTIKTIYNLCKFLSENNTQLNSFDFGSKLEQNNSNVKTYPQIYLEAEIFVNPAAKGQEEFRFSVMYLDRPATIKRENNENVANSMDKMEQVSNQCFEMLKTAITRAQFSEISKITLENVFADNLCGVRVEYSVIDRKENNQCDINSRGLIFKDLYNE